MKKLKSLNILAIVLFSSPVVPSKYSQKMSNSHVPQTYASANKTDLRSAFFGLGAGLMASKMPDLIIVIGKAVSSGLAHSSQNAAQTEDVIPDQNETTESLIDVMTDLNTNTSLPETPLSSIGTPQASSNPDSYKATPGGSIGKRS